MQGMFTQSAYILTFKAPSLDELEAALSDFTLLGRTEAPPDGHWAFGGASLLVAHPDVPEGRIIIDVIDQKWPDGMGDPEREPMLFAAWSAGGFGPSVFPGNLERAGKQAWFWKQASGGIRAHQAFVRLRSTFVTEGAEGLVLPSDYKASDELLLLTQICAAILELNISLAYFNPNGESVRPAEFVAEALKFEAENDALPLDVWTNIRIGRLSEEWVMMDLVGLGQLGLPDVEVCFKAEAYEFEAVDTFIRDIAAYLVEAGDVMAKGDLVDGPGEISWEVLRAEQGLQAPPRPTLRLLPDDGTKRSRQVLEVQPMAAVVAQAQADLERELRAQDPKVVLTNEGES